MGSAGLALTAHLDLRGVPSLVSPVAFLPSLTPTKPSHLLEPLHWPCPTTPSLCQPGLRGFLSSPTSGAAQTCPSRPSHAPSPLLSGFSSRATPMRSLPWPPPWAGLLIPMALCTFRSHPFRPGPGNRLPSFGAESRAGSPTTTTPHPHPPWS